MIMLMIVERFIAIVNDQYQKQAVELMIVAGSYLVDI